jgi:hypothetical protein
MSLVHSSIFALALLELFVMSWDQSGDDDDVNELETTLGMEGKKGREKKEKGKKERMKEPSRQAPARLGIATGGVRCKQSFGNRTYTQVLCHV